MVEGREEAELVNLLMETYASDIAGVGKTGASTVEVSDVDAVKAATTMMTGGLRKAKNVFDVLAGTFHQMERLNREATFLAALELGYRKNIKDGMPHEQAKEAAINEATNDTLEAVFDFSAYNKPTIMTKGIGRAATQFYMYPVSMFSILTRNLFGTLRDVGKQIPLITNPEERAKAKQNLKAEATIAVGSLINIGVWAGTTGIPLFLLAEIVAQQFFKFFGDDEDFAPDEEGNYGPGVDPLFYYRYVWLNKYFGPESTVASALGLSNSQAETLRLAIDKGIIPALTDLDFSGSVALDPFFFVPNEPRKLFSDDIESSVEHYAFSLLLGASGGVALDTLSMIDSALEGEFGRALERGPRVIGNFPKTYRFLTEGQGTRAGPQIGMSADFFTSDKVFAQLLGVGSAQAAAYIDEGYSLKAMSAKEQKSKSDVTRAVRDLATEDFNSILLPRLPLTRGKRSLMLQSSITTGTQILR